MGVGSLTGFVADTLGDREHATAAVLAPRRSALAQLERALTALPEVAAGELSAPFLLGLLATASAPLLAILTAVLGVSRDYIAAESLR